MISLFDNVENTGKRRKCWFTAFSHFPTMFSKASFLRVIKLGLCGKGLNLYKLGNVWGGGGLLWNQRVCPSIPDLCPCVHMYACIIRLCTKY